MPRQIVPEAIVQDIIEDIFTNEVDHRPDLMYVDWETVHAIVRLTILRLERLGVFDEEKLENIEIETYVPVPEEGEE